MVIKNTDDSELSNISSFEEELTDCSDCSEKLCLRERTINLAIGNTDMMYCLKCLSKRENKEAEEILVRIKKYVFARECFRKEWIKYKNISYCPKAGTCFPNTCFAK